MINIKFVVKLGKTATRNLILLREAFGGAVLLRVDVSERCKKFSEGRVCVCRISNMAVWEKIKIDANVEKVRTLVRKGCCLGIRIKAAQSYRQDPNTTILVAL
jgi:hypothetical protein